MLREGNSDRRAPLAVKNYATQAPAPQQAVRRRAPRPASRPWATTTSRSNEKSCVAAARRRPHHPVTSPPTARSPQLKDRPEGRCRARSSTRPSSPPPSSTPSSPQTLEQADGRRRALLGAPQGDHDEGQRPHHLRPRRQGLLRRRLRAVRRASSPRPASPPTTASARSSPAFRRCRGRRRHRRRHRRPAIEPRAPASRTSNSDKGLTNLHVPTDVIVDASMPALDPQRRQALGRRRRRGMTPSPSSRTPPTPSVYPGRHRRRQRATARSIPATIGTVPNVGLMAQAAEEYGSHDKTFEIAAPGRRAGPRQPPATVPPPARRRQPGDIWRATQTKHVAVTRLGEARRHPRPREPAPPPCSGSTRRARTTRSSSPRCRPRASP